MKHSSLLKFYLFVIGFAITFFGCKKNGISTTVGNTSQGQYLTEIDYYSLYSKAQSKQTFTYDANCLQSSQLIASLDTVSGTFNNYELVNYTYNSNGTHATDINQSWNASTGTWVNTGRSTYHYQNGDTSYSSITGESWKNNQWQPESLDSFTYDTDHHLTEELVELYNDTTNTWVAFEKIDYTYNSNGQKIQAIETPLQTTNAMSYGKIIYAYDSSGYLTTQTSQISFNSPDNWINDSQIVYARIAIHQVAQAITQYWNPLSNTWTDIGKAVWNYSNSCH
jgi:hypothetical protein